MTVNAQTFTASPSRVEITTNEQFRIEWKLENDSGDFKYPVTVDFYSGGDIRATSTDINNGHITSSASYSRLFTPKFAGHFKIPAATFTTKQGKILISNEVEIVVTQSYSKKKPEVAEENHMKDWKLEAGRKITANVTNNNINLYKNFSIKWELADTDMKYELPEMKDFKQVSKPVISKYTTNQEYRKSITCIYKAKRPGHFSIPAIIGKSGRKYYQSNPLKINVDDSYYDESKVREPGGSKEYDEYFIKATVDKDKVRLGDTVTVTYTAYYRNIHPSRFDVLKKISFNSFKSPDTPDFNESSFHEKTIDNCTYMVAILKRKKLVPEKTGAIKIDSMACLVTFTSKQTRKKIDPFDDPFFDDPSFAENYMPGGIVDDETKLRNSVQRFLISNEINIEVTK